ncbi:hypothetical protein GUJ93_ZPchr0005g15641 [Zizania palustris]|uniref:Uncharacterized protein n=1 Tax=Zizania palustris TaxID=103762 RepID=A0A8J5SBR8_ZIZPA|nr:hypothetical protein GUJ93_ZPchr0005g15641 [Zizania palustris]
MWRFGPRRAAHGTTDGMDAGDASILGDRLLGVDVHRIDDVPLLDVVASHVTTTVHLYTIDCTRTRRRSCSSSGSYIPGKKHLLPLKSVPTQSDDLQDFRCLGTGLLAASAMMPCRV